MNPSVTSTAADPTLERLAAIERDLAAGRLDAAGAGLDALAAAAPADPRIYLTGARLAQRRGDATQELNHLAQAARVAPGWWPAYAELAKGLSRRERHAEALAAAEHAVALAPRDLAALDIAVAVANAAGAAQNAQRHLASALELRPGDVGIHRALAMALDRLHRPAEAEPHWRAVLAQFPDDVAALGWLGNGLAALGRREEACALLERALALAPEHASLPFHLAVARGEVPPTQPAGIVQQLFDDYAGRFDRHLEDVLKYRAPQRVAEIVRTRRRKLDLDVLDLGCGTGLLGKYLGAVKGSFVGVDLSRKMLEQAVKLGVYSRLRLNDITAELAELAPASFDIVAALDVFIYVGALEAVLPACHKVLKRGGALLFTCETAAEAEGALVLRPSKRYAHSKASVDTLCRAAGFRSVTFEDIDLRNDVTVGGPIAGFLATAEK